MKQILEIKVPNDYSAITLTKYLNMYKDLEVYKDIPEAITATLLWHLCGLEPDILTKIDVDTFTKIKEQLNSFIGKQDHELIRFVTINGVEYGFEPNLSEMTYGAYVDISKYDIVKIDDNWEKIMAILYRPVTKKMGKLYEIEPYTGKEESNHWREVNMDVHLGCMFFFINLSKVLPSVILKSLIMTEEIPTNIKEILERSGELINRLSHSAETT
jgi:hypothetical protein